MGRILAIDYGQKRVGIAVSDELKIIAQGLCTIGVHEIWPFLQTYHQDHTIEAFVVGLPKQMDNTPSQSSRFIEPFVKALAKKYPQIPIHRVDERFTSKMAFQSMIDRGLKKKDRQDKAMVDKISATIILQSFLEFGR